MKDHNSKDNGAVTLIEATIVFPIVFIVLFFIICLGNSYYIRSYMDSMAAQYAVITANYASNETIWQTETSEENKGVEKFKSFNLEGHDINPYQYRVSEKLLDDMDKQFKEAVTGSSNTILASMAPTDIEPDGQNEFVHYDWGLFGSTITVKVKYTINVIPFVKKIGIASKEYSSIGISTINDNVEFIRNLDMVKDIIVDFTQTEKGKKIADGIATKVDAVVDKVKSFFNFFQKKK